MTFIEIRNLLYRYEGWQLACDLQVKRGDMLAVIGPSGAGKSTLLALIAGFEKPAAGTIHINGRDVTAVRPSDRPVTTMFQEHNLFSHLTVADNVGLGRHPGLRLNRADRSAVAAALAAVGLTGFGKRLPSELSGGERRRAALARCICQRRPVLLLDEPFAALDPALRGEMRGLVDRLRREHALTVIMVSHHPNEVSGVAERGVFLHDGRVLAEGPLEDLLRATEPQELRDYLGPGLNIPPGRRRQSP